MLPSLRCWIGEDLGYAAPADVPNEDSLFLFGCSSIFCLKLMRELDRGKVIAAFLSQRTFTDSIPGTNAVIGAV